MLGPKRDTLAEQLARVARRSTNLGQRAGVRHPVATLATATQRASSGVARSERSRRARLEAVLLVASEPLPTRKLAQLAMLTDGTEARSLLDELQESYRSRGAAIEIHQVAGGYRLYTRPEYSAWLGRFFRETPGIKLSSPAMETLSVVAYRQPVLRAEIEAIRGVQCGEILRQLMEYDLLRIVGRSEELGRPFLYGTTNRFLQMFGLKNLEDLPRRIPSDGNVQRDVEKE